MSMDINHLEVEELVQLRDAINRRLLQIRRTPGLTLHELLRLLEDVKQTLTDQGKEWRSLERWQWIDGEIRFWLNPGAQDLYRSGWFSIDDLIAWTHDTGPVVIEEEFFEEDEDFDEPPARTGERMPADERISVTRLPDDLIRRDDTPTLA